MIQANELRIGNIVSYLGKQTVISSIQHTSEMDYVATPKSGAVTKNQIDPIPLTEEWLVRFGFVIYDRRVMIWDMPNKSIFISKDRHSNEFTLGVVFGNSGIPLKIINHVHQLQNLCSSLIGTELELKTI